MSYLYSFAGAGFDLDTDSLGDDVDAEGTEQHIPGGDVTYVDVSGRLAPNKRMTVYFDAPSDYLSLRNLVGAIGTLVDVDGTHTSAWFKRLSRKRRLPGGGQTWATAEFWITS